MASKSDSEFDVGFRDFMEVNIPQLNPFDCALDAMGESDASKRLSRYEKDIDDTPTVQGSNETRKKTVRKGNSKNTRLQSSGKKATRNRKLQVEQNSDVSAVSNKKSKTKVPKNLKRKAAEPLCISSDDDSCSSTHSYNLRPRFVKINEEVTTNNYILRSKTNRNEEVVSVAFSLAEKTFSTGEDEGIVCLPIFETREEELNECIIQTDQWELETSSLCSNNIKQPGTSYSFSINNMAVTSTPIHVNITRMKNYAHKERESYEMDTNREENPAILINDSQEDFEISLHTPVEGLPDCNAQNLASTYIPRHLRTPSKPMDEEQVMNFVDDLLGAETEAIAQLVDDNFDKLLKYNESHTRSRENVILIDDDINIEDNDNNCIEILDDTTSPIIINDSHCEGVPSTSFAARNKIQQASSASTEKLSNGRQDCPICLESMESKEISSTTCGHIFCTLCIKLAIRSTKKCPKCRKGINMKKIHPLYL